MYFFLEITSNKLEYLYFKYYTYPTTFNFHINVSRYAQSQGGNLYLLVPAIGAIKQLVPHWMMYSRDYLKIYNLD